MLALMVLMAYAVPAVPLSKYTGHTAYNTTRFRHTSYCNLYRNEYRNASYTNRCDCSSGYAKATAMFALMTIFWPLMVAGWTTKQINVLMGGNDWFSPTPGLKTPKEKVAIAQKAQKDAEERRATMAIELEALELDAGIKYRCACGSTHDKGEACPNSKALTTGRRSWRS